MRRHNFKLWFDRALSRGIGWQLGIIGVILFICYGISFFALSCSDGWTSLCNNHHQIPQYLLPLYLLIDQNAFNSICFPEEKDRLAVDGILILACAITYILGLVFFGGAIIAILSDFIKRRVESYRNGRTYYLKKGHYLIMGYDDIVPSIITHILSKNKDAQILLLTSTSSQEILEKLRETVARWSLEHIVINYGHRISSDYYREIHLESAEQIFIAGNRQKPKHDAVNVECVESVCAYLEDFKKRNRKYTVKRITCVFDDLDTYAAFRTTDIFSDITNELNIEFVPYNFYVSWARRVFVNRSYIGKAEQKEYAYPCLCKNGIGANDEHYVHLVFVGTSTFAVTFANEAANIFHFPNYKKARTKITFIDRNADIEMPIFITRNHHFFEVQPYYYEDYTTETKKKFEPINTYINEDLKHRAFLDVEFEFIKGDIFSRELQKLIETWAKDEKQYLSLFMGMTDQRSNFAIAMNMPDAIYNNEIPVFVRQDSSDNFITRLQQADKKAPRKGEPEYRTYEKGRIVSKEAHGRYAHLYPFGMNDTSFFSDNTSFRRAKLINYLYQTADYDINSFQPMTALLVLSNESVWKQAEAFWKKLTVAEKWSNLYFAYSIDYKIQSYEAMLKEGLRDNDLVEAMAEAEHNRWNVEKLLMGYRKPKESEDMYDKPKEIKQKLKNNKNLFIHPQIRPFEELSEDMQRLDREFVKYIPWIVKMTKI